MDGKDRCYTTQLDTNLPSSLLILYNEKGDDIISLSRPEANKLFNSSVVTNGNFQKFFKACNFLKENEEPYAWLKLKFKTWAIAKCLVTDRRVLLFKEEGIMDPSLSLEIELDITDLQEVNLEKHGPYSDITLVEKDVERKLKKIPKSEAQQVSKWIENKKSQSEKEDEGEDFWVAGQEREKESEEPKNQNEEKIKMYKRTDDDLDEIKTTSGEFSTQEDPTINVRGQRYEYLRLQLSTQNIESGDKRINELGRAGWELVSAYPTSSEMQAFTGSGATQYVHLYFKRPLNNPKEESEKPKEVSNTSDEEKDHISKIERLHDLKEDGALTEEEFEEEKEELL